VHAEAARRYALIGDTAASMPDRLTIYRDRSCALLFSRLASLTVDDGEAGTADKLQQLKEAGATRSTRRSSLGREPMRRAGARC